LAMMHASSSAHFGTCPPPWPTGILQGNEWRANEMNNKDNKLTAESGKKIQRQKLIIKSLRWNTTGCSIKSKSFRRPNKAVFWTSGLWHRKILSYREIGHVQTFFFHQYPI
jgi:hypothetical protein